MAIINVFIQLADPAYEKNPIRDRLKGIVEGLFRVFDTNKNGIIEQFELNEIFSDVISGIANVLISLTDYLESQLLQVHVYSLFSLRFAPRRVRTNLQ
jgi:hypothetical protein